jgi:membrane fusion protein, copper/silver efflux system
MDKSEIKEQNKSTFLKSVLKLIVTGLIGLFIGIIIQKYLLSNMSQTNQKSNGITQESTSTKTTIWTCSMHPQIRQPKPGKCPICHMDLIPVEQTQVIRQRQIEFTEEALKLMDVQTTTVDRRFVEAQVNLVGKIDFDESRIQNIAAWVPGRIDRLYVDFTGTTVRKGDHLVYLYSPELVSSQAELIEAIKSLENIKPDTSDVIRQTYLSTVESAREKLRLLGLEKEQIDKIEKNGIPTDHLTIYSPIGGIVIEKLAKAGDYVETGKTIYTVADLSRVWVKLDAYEMDLSWIRYGQKVEFITEAYPGETFKGTISFIDPVLDSQTRTVKLRVNTDNSDLRLKPEMFVHAIVRVNPSSDGSVAQPEFAGKWICPMHPDIVKDNEGKCDTCGMDLVSAESLGIDTAASEEPPLVIPASAVLITGKRAVVYVKVPDSNVPRFEGREVVLGPRAGNYYLVKEGLEEGETIVTNGNFKIDSALQIQAKPSMMNPPDQNMPMNHRNEEGQMKEGMNMPGM